MREAGVGFRRPRRRRRHRRARPDRRPDGGPAHRPRRSPWSTACRCVAVNHLEAHALTARLTDGRRVPLPAAAGLGRPLPARRGRGRRPLPPARHHHRRRAGRGVRQGREDAGPGLPGRPGGRARWPATATRAASPCRARCTGPTSCDFSFSGLKTAVRHRILALGAAAGDAATVADLCASFQAAVGDVLVDRSGRALDLLTAEAATPTALVVAGGVAANLALRARLARLAAARGLPLVAPPLALCTDNAVMVAWAGIERLRLGRWTIRACRRGRAGRWRSWRRPRRLDAERSAFAGRLVASSAATLPQVGARRWALGRDGRSPSRGCWLPVPSWIAHRTPRSVVRRCRWHRRRQPARRRSPSGCRTGRSSRSTGRRCDRPTSTRPATATGRVLAARSSWCCRSPRNSRCRPMVAQIPSNSTVDR